MLSGYIFLFPDNLSTRAWRFMDLKRLEAYFGWLTHWVDYNWGYSGFKKADLFPNLFFKKIITGSDAKIQVFFRYFFYSLCSKLCVYYIASEHS